MPLSVAERKERMPYGAQHELAAKLGLSEAYVSRVMAGEIRPKAKGAKLNLRRTQVAIARTLKLSVAETFSVEEIEYALAA